MKILFLNPNTGRLAEESNSATEARAKYLPYSIASCATVIRNAGYQVSVLDAAADDLSLQEWLQKVKDLAPDILVVTVNAVTVDLDLEGLKDFKKKKNFKLITLVVFPSFTEEVLKRHPEIDIGIGVEWAWALLDVAKTLDKNGPPAKVKGIYFRDKQQIKSTPSRKHVNINKLPIPAFELLPVEKYDEYTMISSIGCIYRCLMCPFEKHLVGWESKDVDLVLKEIETMIELGGNKKIVFLDNEFTLNPARTREFCQKIIQGRKKIYWACNTRASTINKELAQLMSQAGCMSAALGVESGVQSILDKNNKKLNLKQVKEAINYLNEAGILSKAYFLIGLLGETQKTAQKTLQFASDLPTYEVSYGLCVPYKDTPMFTYLKKKGWIKDLTIDNLLWIHKNLDEWQVLLKDKRLRGKKPFWRIGKLDFNKLLTLFKDYKIKIQQKKKFSLICYFLRNMNKNLDYFYHTNPKIRLFKLVKSLKI